MWSKWLVHLKSFGATRVDFTTIKKGGSKSGKQITGAKFLIFFENADHVPQKKPIETKM